MPDATGQTPLSHLDKRVALDLLKALDPSDWAEGAVESGGMVQETVTEAAFVNGRYSAVRERRLYRKAGTGETR